MNGPPKLSIGRQITIIVLIVIAIWLAVVASGVMAFSLIIVIIFMILGITKKQRDP